VVIPASAALVREVLGDPLCWTWLTGHRVGVEFVRRTANRATYLVDGVPYVADGDRVCVDDEPVGRWAVTPVAGGAEVRWRQSADPPAPIATVLESLPRAEISWADVPADAAPRAAARALAPLIRARAADSERGRTLDRTVVAGLRAAGIFRIGIPSAIGGLDLPPEEVVDVIDELSHADGAAGWCAFIGNQAAYSAWLDPAVAGKLTGADGLILAGSTAVSGRSERTADGGYRISGRWRFNSGCLHADWLMAGFAEPAVPGAAGPPPARLAFVPPASATVEGTWNVGGLSGSGSHDVLLDGVEVPAEFTAPLYSRPAVFGDALHRLSPYNVQAVLMAGFPLGVARRALDEVEQLAGAGHTGLPAGALTVPLVRARIRLRAARALVRECFAQCWTDVAAGPCLEPRRAAEPALVLRHAVDTAKDVVAEALRLAGPAAGGPRGEALRRCGRDAYAVGQHIATGDDMVERNVRRYAGEQP